MKDLDLKEFFALSAFDGLTLDFKPKFEFAVSKELVTLNHAVYDETIKRLAVLQDPAKVQLVHEFIDKHLEPDQSIERKLQ